MTLASSFAVVSCPRCGELFVCPPPSRRRPSDIGRRQAGRTVVGQERQWAGGAVRQVQLHHHQAPRTHRSGSGADGSSTLRPLINKAHIAPRSRKTQSGLFAAYIAMLAYFVCSSLSVSFFRLSFLLRNWVYIQLPQEEYTHLASESNR